MEGGAEQSLSPSILDYDVFELAGRVFDAYPEPAGLEDFGPYQIRARIDKGGMGEVWRAYDYIAGREVAIKIPRYLSDPALRKRFATEVTHQAKLEHPFIARLYDHGVCPDGTPYFAMEFVDGKPLDEYCRDKNLPLQERVRLLRAVCEAVQYAHGLLVVHRDLKPSNILVKDDGTPKLLDFGVASRLAGADEPARQTQTEAGFTRAFAAPEQFRREPVGVYTDVYALGVILYQLLSGRLPYDLDNCTPGQAEFMVTSDTEPAKPSQAATNTGKADWNDLDVLCLKAMKKDVPRRYSSVVQFAQDLDHYLKGEPLQARPDALSYRVRKFVMRNRNAVVASGLAFALTAVLVLSFTFRLAKARDRAVAEAARTRQIQGFMLSLFGSADHEAAPSKDLRVVGLLDRGVKQAATLGSDPETQAYLYESLGRMYRMLGKYPQADEMLRLALERMKSAVGSEDVKNVDFILQLGALRGDQGKTQEALRMVQDGLNLANRHLPADDATVVGAKSALGRVLVQSAAYDKAIAVLEPLTRIPVEGREGNDNLLETLEALGVANQGVGNYDQARDFTRRALALDRQIYGDSHPRVADDLANLGTLAVTLGRISEAEQRYREAVGILQAWYGPDHPETLQVMSFVALMQIQQNELAEAEPLLRQVLKVQETTYGTDHPNVGLTLDSLGTLERKLGRLPEAQAYFSRALKITEVSFGQGSTQAGIIKDHLGDVFQAEGQYRRAEQFFREALAPYAGRSFKGNMSIGVIEVSLGRALLRQKKFREAEKPLAAGIEILMAQPTAYAARLQQARDDLSTLSRLRGN